jgi:hypothetical protein
MVPERREQRACTDAETVDVADEGASDGQPDIWKAGPFYRPHTNDGKDWGKTQWRGGVVVEPYGMVYGVPWRDYTLIHSRDLPRVGLPEKVSTGVHLPSKTMEEFG